MYKVIFIHNNMSTVIWIKLALDKVELYTKRKQRIYDEEMKKGNDTSTVSTSDSFNSSGMEVTQEYPINNTYSKEVYSPLIGNNYIGLKKSYIMDLFDRIIYDSSEDIKDCVI